MTNIEAATRDAAITPLAALRARMARAELACGEAANQRAAAERRLSRRSEAAPALADAYRAEEVARLLYLAAEKAYLDAARAAR